MSTRRSRVNTDVSVPTRPTNLLKLVGMLGVCLAVYAVSGLVTASSVGTWYQTLNKLTFTPPDWIFPPVWTALYIMMAIAGWLVWRRTDTEAGHWAMLLFAIQLLLNLGWSILFFGLKWIGVALIEILLLWIAIAATTLAFWRIEWRAGLLLVPYLLWVTYATLLNGSIWALN